MAEEVLLTIDGAVGVITLNRPRAINALNRNMIDLLSTAITDWQDNDQIAAIVLNGDGERGFCAGGDVREVRDLVLNDRAHDADAFFEREYALNKRISTSQKPIVALTHGVVMGGGIGLAGHAQCRITTDDSKFAMPESAIGLMCDVGVNALLAKISDAYALLFSLTGLPAGAGDALGLGLTDYVIPTAAFNQTKELVIAALQVGSLDALRDQMATHCVTQCATPMADVAQKIAACFEGKRAVDIVENITKFSDQDDDIAEILEVLATRCPTSLEAIVQNFRAAKRNDTIAAVLKNDQNLASWMVRRTDYAEGVRALLVDKDRAPKWVPLRGEDVDSHAISSLIS